MGKKGKMPDMNLPIWFDGQNINEALFCEEFLRERRIIFANGAFFTPDGRVILCREQHPPEDHQYSGGAETGSTSA